MKRTKSLALLLAVLMMISVFAIPAFAEESINTEDSSSVSPSEESESGTSTEPSDDPSTDTPSQPESSDTPSADDSSSEPSAESSEEPSVDSSDEPSDIPSDESSDAPSADPSEDSSEEVPDTYKVNISFDDYAGSATVKLNGTAVSGSTYLGSDPTLAMTVEPAAGYQIVEVFFETTKFTSSDGIHSATAYRLETGKEYNLSIKTKRTPNPVSLNIRTKFDESLKLNVKFFANGTEIKSDYQWTAGDRVKIVFEINSAFDPALANFTVNGTSVTLTSNTYEFEIAENTNIELVYGFVAVKFILHGPGKYVVTGIGDIVNNAIDTLEQIIYLKKGSFYTLNVVPGDGYEMSGRVEFTSNGRREEKDGTYYFYADNDGTVTARLKAIPGYEHGNNPGVSLSVGGGGKVTYGSQTVFGGSGASIVVTSGTDLEFALTPDEGYELDSVTVNGTETEVTDGVFKLENITETTSVQVLFKIIGEVTDAIGIDNIDWSSENIIVNLDGKLVNTTVFEKIATLTGEQYAGKYVEFASEHGSIFVPCGSKISGSSNLANLNIVPLTSGDVFDTVEDAIADKKKGNSLRKLYTVSPGVYLPEGTLIQFKIIDITFSGKKLGLYLFDSQKNDFTMNPANNGAVAMPAKTYTAKYVYENEGILILADDSFIQFELEAIATPPGGMIDDAGITSVGIYASRTYNVTALAGYVIDKVFVDGVEVEGARGMSKYTHEFKNISAAHKIEASFKLVEPVGGGTSADDTDSGSSKSLIATLVIVLVALTGTGALFAVKYRGERTK